MFSGCDSWSMLTITYSSSIPLSLSGAGAAGAPRRPRRHRSAPWEARRLPVEVLLVYLLGPRRRRCLSGELTNVDAYRAVAVFDGEGVRGWELRYGGHALQLCKDAALLPPRRGGALTINITITITINITISLLPAPVPSILPSLL